MVVSVMGIDGEIRKCEVIVDTGFTGWLVFPEADIRRTGLSGEGNRDNVTASGDMERFDYCETSALWHGQVHGIEVFQSIDHLFWAWSCLKATGFQWKLGTAVT